MSRLKLIEAQEAHGKAGMDKVLRGDALLDAQEQRRRAYWGDKDAPVATVASREAGQS